MQTYIKDRVDNLSNCSLEVLCADLILKLDSFESFRPLGPHMFNQLVKRDDSIIIQVNFFHAFIDVLI